MDTTQTDVHSLRGKLIKEVVAAFCEKSFFVPFNEIEKSLQAQLDEHLKFDTHISDLKQGGNFSSGNISFDEGNRVIKFTVITKVVIDNESFS